MVVRPVSLIDIVRQRLESGASADCVDRLEAASRYQPGARVGRHAIARPLLQRRRESFVQRFLGEIEVAEQAYQGGEDLPRVRAVDSIRRVARVPGRGIRAGFRFVIRQNLALILRMKISPK